MKAGGDSVGQAWPSNSEARVREPSSWDYVGASVLTGGGLWIVGASTYELATDAGSRGDTISLSGLAGVGTAFILEGINYFRGPERDATSRQLHLTSGYVMSLSIVTAATGEIVNGVENESDAETRVGAFFTILGLGLFGYTLHADLAGARRGKPGLFGSLVQNLAVGPGGIATAVQF